jgi:hypothetical protein
MLELILLASFSGVIGMAIRAKLENEKEKFYYYHIPATAIAIGLYAFLTYNSISIPVLSAANYLGIFIMFSMMGYVFSDVLDSVIYIFTHPIPVKIVKVKNGIRIVKRRVA